MNRATVIQLFIFSAIIVFLSLSLLISTLKPMQPKIMVTTPKVIIQQPAPKIVQKTIVIKRQERLPQKKGLLRTIGRMFRR